MEQKTKYLLAAGGVTLVILTAYKAMGKSSKMPVDPNNPLPVYGYGDATPESEYITKVKALQSALNVTPVSGWAGPLTNAAVQKAYPTLAKKLGAVSESNIDEYLKAKPETPPKVNDRVQQIWDAMGDGTPAVLRVGGRYNAYYYDKAGKAWRPTDGSFDVPANTKIYKSKSVLMTTGIISTVTVKGGAVKNIFFTPNNLYVA